MPINEGQRAHLFERISFDAKARDQFIAAKINRTTVRIPGAGRVTLREKFQLNDQQFNAYTLLIQRFVGIHYLSERDFYPQNIPYIYKNELEAFKTSIRKEAREAGVPSGLVHSSGQRAEVYQKLWEKELKRQQRAGLSDHVSTTQGHWPDKFELPDPIEEE